MKRNASRKKRFFNPSKVEGSNFAKRVCAVVCRIPRGKTLTYKQVAAKAGNAMAARAVGLIMSKNFDDDIPCHRVVRSDGKVGGYNRGGPPRKVELLLMERNNA